MNSLKRLISFAVKVGAFLLLGYASYRATKMFRERQSQLPLKLGPEYEPKQKTPRQVVKEAVTTLAVDLNNRQQRVFTFIKQQGKAGMKELTGQVQGVTERTLRRDLQALLDARLIRKEGKTKAASYSVLDTKKTKS